MPPAPPARRQAALVCAVLAGMLCRSAALVRAPAGLGGFARRVVGVAGTTRRALAMQVEYNHAEVEGKWQKVWDETDAFKAERHSGRPKAYTLSMFPFPSAQGLHVGHVVGYAAVDIVARTMRLQGVDVLMPMGFDAFGLPAEQYAINTGTPPAESTARAVDNFRRQLKSLGLSYDWARELATTDEEYYRWTQWIFLQLFEAGLAEQREVPVNWCPALGTVLANEEVIDGLSERGSHPVVRVPLRQWVLRITDYADRLVEGLDGLDWPMGTLQAQKRWIGRSEGVHADFVVQRGEGLTDAAGEEVVKVFTTRADTLMGVTYVVLAPEHPLVSSLTTPEQKEAVEAYASATAAKSDLERTAVGADKGKTGVFTGSYARHPLTGETVPVWVADYVLGSYGTGAVMAVPAHDERDYAFAQTHDLEVRRVVDGGDLPYTEDGVLVGSGEGYDGLTSEQARAKVAEELSSKERGEATVTYKLRDWVFSRQRYWGEPIPIYFPVDMEDHEAGDPRAGDAHTILYDKPIAVPQEELPLLLPQMDDISPGEDPAGCLARAVDWRYFKKDDGKWYARETNTMPQWAGSCWYYLRFLEPWNTEAAFTEQSQKDWMPVDLYVGGQEHAVLHLLYARFWHMVMYDRGLVTTPEPFVKLVHQGMILGPDGDKMSKSKGNVINPDDVIQAHGADVLRMYEMFMGPLEAAKPWQTEQLTGVVRFRDRVLNVVMGKGGVSEEAADDETLRLMHKTIKKVTQDIANLNFNTAISALMVLTTRLLSLEGPPPREVVEALIVMLSPFAPHVAEECWQTLGHDEMIKGATWPTYDEALTVDDVVEVAVQVNGKLRATVQLSPEAPEPDALEKAFSNDSVKKHTDGKEVKRVIYRSGKILNIVV